VSGTELILRTDLDTNRELRDAGIVNVISGVIFGATVIELIPRAIVGGVLVFVGVGLIVEWAWDRRRWLPKGEYVVVLAIILFAINYGRVEQIPRWIRSACRQPRSRASRVPSVRSPSTRRGRACGSR